MTVSWPGVLIRRLFTLAAQRHNTILQKATQRAWLRLLPVCPSCVSAAFLATHPTELVVDDCLLWPAAPRFELGATAGEAPARSSCRTSAPGYRRAMPCTGCWTAWTVGPP